MVEFLTRINIFRSRKNWLALTNWVWTAGLAVFLLAFLRAYFSWPLLGLGLVYGLVFMGSHGTVWFHRYGSHRAYAFRSPLARFITRNLVLKVVPEEIYIISHYIHHAKSDGPGDPYNASFGGLYCFLADVNHQPISRNLSRSDYAGHGRAHGHAHQ